MEQIKKGRILSANGLFFDVQIDEEIYSSKISGKVKKQLLKPKVGDFVDLKIITDHSFAMIDYIYPRKNNFERPSVSNIDKAIIVSSLKEPNLDLYLLLKFITIFQFQNIEPVLVFSKNDLLSKEEQKHFQNYFTFLEKLYSIVILDYKKSKSSKSVLKLLTQGEINIITGQTGVGKSTFLNDLNKELNLKTNQISKKLNRGKHTTRDYKTYFIDKYMLIDSPGFSSLSLEQIDKKDISKSFLDFNTYSCKFQNCTHSHEPGCELKAKLEIKNDLILNEIYEIYLDIIKK